jgi:hypothetical protein
MSVSTLADSKVMAPEALRDRIEMSCGEMPYGAPSAIVAVRSCLVRVVVSMPSTIVVAIWWCKQSDCTGVLHAL